jgi:prephenate dehydrogenase
MQPLQHERFAILGYGRFGGALAQLLQQAGYAVRVFDPAAQPPDALAAASPAAAIRDADWVVLAMPVPRMQDALRQVRPLLDARHTVIDVGSVKQQPCLWLEEMLGDAIPPQACAPAPCSHGWVAKPSKAIRPVTTARWR